MSSPLTTDILFIDAVIRDKLEKTQCKSDELYARLKELKELYKLSDITSDTKKCIENDITDITTKINNIDTNIEYSFYVSEITPIIDRYKVILKTPQVVSFIKKTVENEEKKQVIQDFFEIAKKYINIKVDIGKEPISKIIKCECGNKDNFDIVDYDYICLDCGSVKEKELENTSYTDVDRINIAIKYSYDRKNHFRDTMYQYQGKQNCIIPDTVYQDIIRECEKNGLLVGDKNTNKSIRFKNVTKKHINIFLKHLGYNKHYENLHYIHWKLTDKKRNDISHLEDVLLEEFSTLVKLYFSIYKKNQDLNRKSFINTHHIFYQLLLKHGYNCNKDDFPLLKTIDRMAFHDTICLEMFNILGWKYTSFY